MSGSGKKGLGCCAALQEAIGNYALRSSKVFDAILINDIIPVDQRVARTVFFEQFLARVNARIRQAFNDLFECTLCRKSPCCAASAHAIVNSGLGAIILGFETILSLGNLVPTLGALLDAIFAELESTLEIILREGCRVQDCGTSDCDHEEREHDEKPRYKPHDIKHKGDDRHDRYDFYNYVNIGCCDEKNEKPKCHKYYEKDDKPKCHKYYENDDKPKYHKYYEKNEYCHEDRGVKWEPERKYYDKCKCKKKDVCKKPWCNDIHNKPYYNENKNDRACRLFDEKQKYKYNF